MKSINECFFPEQCRYTVEHIWALREGEELVLGISDFAQDQLGEILFVDLPEVGSHMAAGAEFGTVESLKSVNALFMPVAGMVTAVNGTIADSPTLLNSAPYAAGWLIRIRPDNMADYDTLLPTQEYIQPLISAK